MAMMRSLTYSSRSDPSCMYGIELSCLGAHVLLAAIATTTAMLPTMHTAYTVIRVFADDASVAGRAWRVNNGIYTRRAHLFI
jgi:hypothetical protein